MKVALVIGHKPSSPGQGNKKYGIDEWNYNNALAEKISIELGEREINCVIVQRDSLRYLPDKIDALEPDFIVSLHCNEYEEKEGQKEATGTEVLYYHSSKKGQEIADIMQQNLSRALGLRDRGIKPKHSEDRGGYLLRYTDAPCVICEPFFIDNDSDCERAFAKEVFLVDGYADGIEDCIEELFDV